MVTLPGCFELDDSDQCVEFFIEVMALSSQEGHIPDICMKESRFVEISYYTYLAGGIDIKRFYYGSKTKYTQARTVMSF